MTDAHTQASEQRLYCWAHNTVHELTARQVEELVYALTWAAPVSYEIGFLDGNKDEEAGRVPQWTWPDCPLVALDDREVQERILEGVEAAAEFRELTPSVLSGEPGPWRLTLRRNRVTRRWIVLVAYLSPDVHGGRAAQDVAALRGYANASEAIAAGQEFCRAEDGTAPAGGEER